jgi:hypothetical protein
MGRCRTRFAVALPMALLASGLSLIILSVGDSVVWGDSSDAPSLSAKEMIDEARFAEVDGRNADHDYWARQALQRAPSDPAAHWLAGEVRLDGRWATIDEAASTLAGNEHYREYLRIRSRYAATVRDQTRLAEWCAGYKLKDQARAHYSRVLELDPNNTVAHKRLGHKLLGGQWRTGQEITQNRTREKQLRSDLIGWQRTMLKLRADLSAADEDRRESARRQLSAIDDPGAIPAMERMLASVAGTSGVAATETIGRIPGQDASMSLARLAAFSPWKEVRDRAAAELKSRPLVEFVPSMLATMIAPVEYREEVYTGNAAPAKRAAATGQANQPAPAGNRLLQRQVFARETQSARVERAFDTQFVLQGSPAITPVLAQMAVLSNGLTAPQQSALNAENARTSQTNGRIVEVLAAVTGEKLGPSPKAWWDWWDQYNDVYREPKLAQTTYEPKYTPMPLLLPSSLMRYGGECFAAGTTVWTIEGPKAVERIAVGDMVLAQNADTGELAYKPVLRAAERPPIPLVAVTVEGEVIRCTGGHPFWVPGSGWVHAKRLDTPAWLHALSGAAQAISVEKVAKEKTYNLEVADFHSYFVGRGKILVHDVTPLGPTTTEVPGLKSP